MPRYKSLIWHPLKTGTKPQEIGRYLVTLQTYNVLDVKVARWTGREWRHIVDNFPLNTAETKVVAWMPFPRPYKGALK